MELQQAYQTLHTHRDVVLSAGAIGIFGPMPPSDGNYLGAAARLREMEVDNRQAFYRPRHFMHFGLAAQLISPLGVSLEASRETGAAMLELAYLGVLRHENYSESMDLDRWKTEPSFGILLPENDIGNFVQSLSHGIDARNPETDGNLMAIDTYMFDAMQRSEMRSVYCTLRENAHLFEDLKIGKWGKKSIPIDPIVKRLADAGIVVIEDSHPHGRYRYHSSPDFRRLLPGNPDFHSQRGATHPEELADARARVKVFERLAKNVGWRRVGPDKDLIAIDRYVLDYIDS
jgi:hypothetical protein